MRTIHSLSSHTLAYPVHIQESDQISLDMQSSYKHHERRFSYDP